MYQAVNLAMKHFDCLADNYSKRKKKRSKPQLVKRFQLPQQETINLKNDVTNQNDRFSPKNTVTVKRETMKKKYILTKNVECLE